jgi:GNAT superfamily N-acetyltransferase
MYFEMVFILSIIIIILICVWIFIRLKYPFWCIQPVFHFYDIPYYFYNKGIIRLNLPEKNKYTNFKAIETVTMNTLNENKWKEIVRFLNKHFLKNVDSEFVCTTQYISCYFKSCDISAFISFYSVPRLLTDVKNNTLIKDSQIAGIMTSRPVQVSIQTLNCKNKGDFDAYYVDYLCINKEWRKKGIASQLIQTHEYNQSHMNKNICVSLFKNEGSNFIKRGINPVTCYESYLFATHHWRQPIPLILPFKTVFVNSQNIHLFHDFLKENQKEWSIQILMNISSLLDLITQKYWYIIILLHNDKICAAYIFKDIYTTIYKDNIIDFKNKKMETNMVISCIASLYNKDTDFSTFIQGFKNGLWTIIEQKNTYKYVCIESISNNFLLINNLCIKSRPIYIIKNGYFFYNFAYQTFDSSKCLILL